jgi:glycosyltransferase involved in cell wall biosynthesis
MKLLFITSLYYPNEPGGAEVITRRIAEFLADKGYKPEVLSFDAEHTSVVEELNGVKVTRLYVKNLSGVLLEKTRNRSSLGKWKLLVMLLNRGIWKELKNEILRFKSSILTAEIIHYSNSLNSIPHGKLSKLLKRLFPAAKQVLTFHDFFFLGRRTIYPNNKIPLVSFVKRKQLVKNIDWFITPSDYVKEIAQSDLKTTSIKKLYNFTNVNLKSVRTERSFPLTLIYAGSVEYGKGVDTLCRVFTNLHSEFGSKVKLVIIGRGDYYDDAASSLKDLPSESYKLYPWLPYEEMRKIMSEADLFILPSRFNETFGMTLIDAFASGCLPISSDRGALPEILNRNKALIFSSEKELFNIIKSFLNDLSSIDYHYRSLISHMEQFDSDTALNEYLKFYSKVLSQ